MFAPLGTYTKAIRRGKAPPEAPAPALVVPAARETMGSMASSTGKATAVPNPRRKVRRGIAQDLLITVLFLLERVPDEIIGLMLQRQSKNSQLRPWERGSAGAGAAAGSCALRSGGALLRLATGA
jgi:hypothetical protein